VKPNYGHLQETLHLVTEERDLAVREKDLLQDKLENLEQVLKVRMETGLRSVPGYQTGRS
ncbi:hypothetical protein scyTo_0024241, partial [Scyliorhinus torazame]|nr:hypothetical protein [Scyliorhinus torazame]